jgi:predicted nucleic acid-binding protein
LILVDTSVWVDHLRRAEPELNRLLQTFDALVHPFVVGELALGGLQNRSSILTFLQIQPQAQVIADSIVLQLIGKHGLYGRGIGYVDAHLLAAASMTPSTSLWTRDKKLRAASARLGIACPLR